MNQRQKFGFFLTALVALPIFSLGLFGLNAIQSELSSYKLHEREVATNRLNDLTSKITIKLLEIQAPLKTAIVDIHQQGEWALRCTFQRVCTQYEEQGLELIISYDNNGDQIYPPPEVTGQLYPENQALKKMASALYTARTALSEISVTQQQKGVWSTYISPEGHKLIYCWHGSALDYTFCAALKRNWLISKVTKIIKEGIPEKDTHVFRLMNENETLIWQSREEATSTLTAQKQLQNPLYFWRLEVWQSANLAERSYPFTIMALTIPLIGLLISIAFILFKTQNEALAMADKRAAIAASVSHELRTPLANLQLYASLILTKAAKEETETNKDIAKFANVISSETHRLSELDNNALTLTSGKGRGPRQKSKEIPDHVITETISHLGPLLGENLSLITFDLNASTPVLLDRSALEQILVNLIDNARKYAPHQKINIRSRVEKNMLHLSVRDWGQNFRTHKLARLFTPFYQRKQSSTAADQPSGFGLGLAVCKELAEENNGSITCEAAHPGARFRVTLEVETPPKDKEKTETNREETTCIS